MFAWMEFIIALLAFFATHLVPIRLKGRMTRCIGRAGYLVFFSALSLAALYWLIIAAGRAPQIPLWPQTGWMRWLANGVMPVAFVLGAMGGLVGIVMGLVLWSAVHLLANGDLAHVVLFSLMLGYGLAGLARMGARLRLAWSPLRLALGLGLWALVWYLHLPLIGVTPTPF